MGEDDMRKFEYTNRIDTEIINHEKNMLSLYRKKIKKYMPLFEENGYSLKVGLMWKYFPRDTSILQRENFKNGYQCYVYCVVLKNGKEVRIRSIDGDADYYTLSSSWMISSIFRKFYKLNVELYTYTNDAEDDLNDFLSQVKILKIN